MRPLLVLRIGYMELYDGPGTITSGGAYVKARGVGGEVYNFKPSRGKCYGYAMSLHSSGLNLKFIDDTRHWQEGDELSGVDVVFIARRPSGGQVVVGWYRNATVFHRQYRVRRGAIAGMDDAARRYLCVADAESATLLPDAERTFPVPYAPAGFAGFPGQSNVWYPEHHSQNAGVSSFLRRLATYISAARSQPLASDEDKPVQSRPKGARGRKPDQAHNAAVETAAEKFAWTYYEAAGYRVDDVTSENWGWDFVVSKGRKTLHVEVKGVSASSIYFELTPNEYAKLQEFASQYRVCVVCDALTEPRLFELLPQRWKNGWRLTSRRPAVHVPLAEKIAAVGVEVALDMFVS